MTANPASFLAKIRSLARHLRPRLDRQRPYLHRINANIVIPAPEKPSSLDQVFEDLFKNYIPELKHQSKKRFFRALPAIRTYEGEKSLSKITASDLEEEKAKLVANVPFKRLFALVRPEKKRIAIAMTATLASTISTLVFPKAVGTIVDLVYNGAEMSQINMYLSGMLMLTAMGSVSVAIRSAQLSIVSEQIARILRKGVFHSMVFQKLPFFDSSDTGRLVNRLSTDTQMVSSTLTDNLARVLRASIGSTSCLCFLYAISPELTAHTIVVFPAFLTTAIVYGYYRKNLTQNLLSALANENQISTERLYGIRTVHSFGKELTEIYRYNNAVDKTFHYAKKLGIAEGFFLGGGFLIGQTTLIGVLYYGSLLLQAGDMTLGGLTSFCMYTGYLFLSVGQISVSVGEFYKAQGAARRVFTIIDAYQVQRRLNKAKMKQQHAPPSPSASPAAAPTSNINPATHFDPQNLKDPATILNVLDSSGSLKVNTLSSDKSLDISINTTSTNNLNTVLASPISKWDLHSPIDNIEFKNISFAYPTKPDHKIIQDLNLSFKIGSAIAITGQSGSGKSTLGSLLMSYYNNYDGQILINGREIRTIDPKQLRKKISEVTQDPVLFSGTVLDNITYSSDREFNPDTDMDRVDHMANLAQASEFIAKMPHGYLSQVGEKGRLLSGGMRQRIALARAIYKPDAEILLLDEFTSALDGKNEKLVIDNILNIKENPFSKHPITKIIFTHNNAVMKAVDSIVVIADGKVKVTGTYDELTQRNELAQLATINRSFGFNTSGS